MLNCVLDPCSMVCVQTWDSTAPDCSRIAEAVGVDWPTNTGLLRADASRSFVSAPWIGWS